jgi:hypothetical protein
VAKKEHQEFASNIDLIDCLPPGLYEAVMQKKKADAAHVELATGNYISRFERRTMDDIRALGGNTLDEERCFAAVARLSEVNNGLYRTTGQPVVRALATEQGAECLRRMHPLRLGYELFSDRNPAMKPLTSAVQGVRENRQPVPADNMFLQWEKNFLGLDDVQPECLPGLAGHADGAHVLWALRPTLALCRAGEAEALMKGSLHTDELMGAVVPSATGLRTERRISHVFAMDVPTYPRPLVITDAAVNIYPKLEDKVDILKNAIQLTHALNIQNPKVAILSAVETVNPKIPATVDAAALCKMADRGQIEGAVIDGPLAFDNVISKEAALIKGIHSPVAGEADILLVPGLEAGNMLAKQLAYLAKAGSAGIVL